MFRSMLQHFRYANIINRIRGGISSGRKVRVLFLVRQNSKWSYQSLYEALAQSGGYEVCVATSAMMRRKATAEQLAAMEAETNENYEFFTRRGLHTVRAYAGGNFVDLAVFQPDIVFYDQPWNLPRIHRPQRVSRFALTAYSSYSVEIADVAIDYTAKFHRLLWRYFTEDDSNNRRYERYRRGNSANCVTTGHPKLDTCRQAASADGQKYWRDMHKFKIIYAPHHTFDDDSLRFATFQRNGRYILEYAKMHPETTWLFKPHPRFKEAVIRAGLMSSEEVEAYYAAWQEIGSVYTQGDYFDIFKTSDLMLTDCCSFLAEYLLTGKPLIRLSNEGAVGLNELGRKICAGGYSVTSNEELAAQIERLKRGEDSKKAERTAIIEVVLPLSAAANIKNYIEEKLQ